MQQLGGVSVLFANVRFRKTKSAYLKLFLLVFPRKGVLRHGTIDDGAPS
jgi:hypothetical protein